MRAYLTFQQRDGWSFHLLMDDLGTPLTGWIRVAGDENTLLGIITRLNGFTEDAKRDIRRWNRGGAWVDLSPAQRRYFGIRTS